MFFELVIRRREFAEIGDLIKSVKYSNEIVDAFPRRHQLDSTIEADINKAKTGELIDLIGTSQRVLFSEHPGYEALADATDNDCALLGKLLLVARDLAKKLDVSGGYRVVINSGPDAGESVPHLHVHLLGKRALAWPPG